MHDRYEDVFSHITDEELSVPFPDERRSKSGQLYVANEYVDTRKGKKTMSEKDVQVLSDKAYEKLKDHPSLVSQQRQQQQQQASANPNRKIHHGRLTRSGMVDIVNRVSEKARELAPEDTEDAWHVSPSEPPDIMAEDARCETADYQIVLSDTNDNNERLRHKIPSDKLVYGQLMTSMSAELVRHLLNIDYMRMFFIKFAPQLSLTPEKRPLKDLYALVMYHTVFFGGKIETMNVSQAPGSTQWRVLMRIKFNNNSDSYQMERELLFDPEKPISLKELRYNVDDHMRLVLAYDVVRGDVSRIAGDSNEPSPLMSNVLVRLVSGEFLWAFQ